MLTEYSQQKLKLWKKESKKSVNNFYQVIEAYEKIHMLEKELNFNYMFIYNNSISISYYLKEDDTLAYIANYILEKIEEKINFSEVTYKKYPEMSNFDFKCKYADIYVNIVFDTSLSKNCVVEYEEVMVKQTNAIMKCL